MSELLSALIGSADRFTSSGRCIMYVGLSLPDEDVCFNTHSRLKLAPQPTLLLGFSFPAHLPLIFFLFALG